MGYRIVLNHSSNLPKLISKLHKLCASETLIKTIVPARISQTRHGRASNTTIRVKTPLPHGAGWKCLGRRGHTVQEVFVIAPELSKERLEERLQFLGLSTPSKNDDHMKRRLVELSGESEHKLDARIKVLTAELSALKQKSKK